MFKFITTKPFWVNLLVAIVLVVLIIFTVLQLLGWITKHGEHLTVPEVKGMKTDESIKLLEKQGFDVVIQDSVYTDSLPKGTVIKQLPEANSTVKINRTVFITINRTEPPMIGMPQLVGKSYIFALDLLRRSHLKLGDTTYKPDFMKGSILSQSYNGDDIKAGDKVRWGSKIDLVIAGGLVEKQLVVPDLINLTYAEAKAILDSNGIIIGSILPVGTITDTATSFVVKQNPPKYDEDRRLMFIHSGQFMDLYISPVKKKSDDSTTITPPTNTN